MREKKVTRAVTVAVNAMVMSCAFHDEAGAKRVAAPSRDDTKYKERQNVHNALVKRISLVRKRCEQCLGLLVSDIEYIHD